MFIISLYLSVLSVTVVLTILSVLFSQSFHLITPTRYLLALIVPCYVVIRGLSHRSLTYSGASAALLVGLVITVSNYAYMASTLVFFFTSTRFTRLKADRKRLIYGESHDSAHGRDWTQVLCNGGVLLELSLLGIMDAGCGFERPVDYAHRYNQAWLDMAALGSLACATADTWASEIGSVYGFSIPRLVTTWQKVPAGTNGAVTMVGLAASFLGGFLMGVCYLLCTYLFAPPYLWTQAPKQWPIVILAGFTGLFGSLFDSLVGATLQFSGCDTKTGAIVQHSGPGIKRISGAEYLDNNSVNLLATVVSACLSGEVGFYLWYYLQ